MIEGEKNTKIQFWKEFLLFPSQISTCSGQWRLRTCVTWPVPHLSPHIPTIPACIETCTLSQSPWSRSIRWVQSAVGAETCSRVRCYINSCNIHKDKSKRDAQNQRCKKIHKNKWRFETVCLCLYLQWRSCSSGKKEKTFRLTQQHSELSNTHRHHQTRARYTQTCSFPTSQLNCLTPLMF